MKISILILLIIGVILCNGKTLIVYWSAAGVSELEVEQGDTVIWKLLDTDEQPGHLIKSTIGNEINGKPFSKLTDASHVFENIGTFEYECALHPEMKSIINVTPQKYEYQGVQDESNPYSEQLALQKQQKKAYIQREIEKNNAIINKRAELYERQQKQKEGGFINGDVVEQEDRNAQQDFEHAQQDFEKEIENQNQDHSQDNQSEENKVTKKPTSTPKVTKSSSSSEQVKPTKTPKPKGPVDIPATIEDDVESTSDTSTSDNSAKDSGSSSKNGKTKSTNSESMGNIVSPMYTLLLSMLIGFFIIFY